MSFPFYIARRYLKSKKSHNIINIITGIAIAGVATGTMALIVVLSVFNGFEDLVKSLYHAFDPDLNVTVKEGKSFVFDDSMKEKLNNLEGLASYVEVVEEKALLKHKSEQMIVNMKGVGENYQDLVSIDTMLVDGDWVFQSEGNSFMVMGYLVAYKLGIRLFDMNNPIVAYVPRRNAKSFTSLNQSFNSQPMFASAVFALQQEIDAGYVIVSSKVMRQLLEYDEQEVTAIELKLETDANTKQIQHAVQQLFGKDFSVKNRYQQQELLYKIMKSEKLAIFLILSFILIIAAFNVIGSLTMLVLDKRRDIAVLFSLGANRKTIRRIFLLEGILVSLIGSVSGLVLGLFLCLIQQEFGLIRLGDAGSFIVPYYPVKLQLLDFILVFAVVSIIGFVSSWFPARQISSRFLKNRISDFTKTQ